MEHPEGRNLTHVGVNTPTLPGVQLIHPELRPTSPEELATGLRLHELAPASRPYLGLNMVASLDGKATLDWRTRGLSSEVDRRLFHHLRTQADAVMVGAGTAREERYGRMTKNDELRQKRTNEGLVPDALAVLVSGRLDLPPDLPLLNDPDQRVVIATGSEEELPGLQGDVEYARVGDDLPRLLAYLHEKHAVRSVLCEGGPTLNSFLFAANLVDELFLSLSPKIVGGGAALTIVAGRELVEPRDARLISVAEAEGELFTRWRFSAS
jgi:riboflavin-specific deaminase-like protein